MKGYILLKVLDIIPNPEQPRKSIRKIKELADSMEELGQLVPISVREILEKERKTLRTKAHYMIANGGERRWIAVKLLKWNTIKAIIEEPNTCAMLAENIARDEMCVLERMVGISRVFEKKFGKDWRIILSHLHNSSKNLGKDELAIQKMCKAIGLAPTTIYLDCVVLSIPEKVQERILEYRDMFTDGSIRKLAGLETEKSKEYVVEKAIEKEYTSTQITREIFKTSRQEFGCKFSAEDAKWYELMEGWGKNFYGTKSRLLDAENLKKVPEEFSRFLENAKELHEISGRVIKNLEGK